MKVLAIIDVATGVSPESVRTRLEEEIRGSWALFACGVLREAYATASPTRVVFVVEAEDARGAQERLATLPLVAAKMLRVELIELRPFVNWSTLFRPTP
jgi:hypothetical protein